MSNAPITVADQNWRKSGSSHNTDALISVTMRVFSLRFVRDMLVCCVRYVYVSSI